MPFGKRLSCNEAQLVAATPRQAWLLSEARERSGAFSFGAAKRPGRLKQLRQSSFRTRYPSALKGLMLSRATRERLDKLQKPVPHLSRSQVYSNSATQISPFASRQRRVRARVGVGQRLKTLPLVAT